MSIATLIISLRILCEDAPDSKLVEGEQVGGADTPWYPIDGSNKIFQLKNKPLADTGTVASPGSPVYTWLTIIGTGATTRAQTGFTIIDQINSIISFSAAPNPGTSTPNAGIYFSYNYLDYSDAKYTEWLSEAAQLTLAGVTDATFVPVGLSAAMLQYGVWLYAQSRQAFFARQYEAHAGDSSEAAQTRAQQYGALARAAKANADMLKVDYYKRQGEREEPSSASICHNWDPISPIR